jgi:alpha 1,2-mannosyltransferase
MMHLRPRNILGGALFLFTVAVFLVLHTQYEAIRSYIPSRTSHKNGASNGPYVDLAPLPSGYAHLLPGLRLPAQLEAYPLLHERLHAFLSRPVRSYDAARPLNERLCPRDLSDRLVNPDQLNGDGEFWREDVDEEVIRKKRVEMVRYLVEVIERGDKVVWDVEEDEKIQQAELLADINPDIARRAPLPSTSQRGFVSAAGNSDTTQRLLTLVRILRRHYHVTLPFQVWTFPDELSRHSAEYIELTEELGATVHETKGLVKDPGAWKNFQIKGLAITSSSFRELVYLDSDNIPLRDPTKLFNSERYLNRGARAAFWPDLSKDHVDNAIWRIIGDECTLDDWTFESGQIVIDKVRSTSSPSPRHF